MPDAYDPRARAAALGALVKFEGPLESLVSKLSVFPWDWVGEPLIIVAESDIRSALESWSVGQLTAEALFTWATALECRDDVDFANAKVASAVHELANPDLQAGNFVDNLAADFSGQ